MLKKYEDKAIRASRAIARAHAPSPRHGIDFVEICDGLHDRSAPCRFRQATDAERAEFRHARLEVK